MWQGNGITQAGIWRFSDGLSVLSATAIFRLYLGYI